MKTHVLSHVTRILAIASALAVSLLVVAAGFGRSERPYGGLGSTVAAFYASNPHGPGAPGLGLAYYHVVSTKHGRVTAYSVVENVKPRDSTRDRMSLTEGINLPADAVATSLNNNTCEVWRSRKLGKLIGMQYAAATSSPHTTTAYMQAESKPRC